MATPIIEGKFYITVGNCSPAQVYRCQPRASLGKSAFLCVGYLRSAMLTLFCTMDRRMPGSKFPCDLLQAYLCKNIRRRNRCVLRRVLSCTQLAAQCTLISNEEVLEVGLCSYFFFPGYPQTGELRS